MLEDVTLSAGGRDLLTGATWRLLPGQRTGLVGVNGCGKSTLLRALVGRGDFNGYVALSLDTELAYLEQTWVLHPILSYEEVPLSCSLFASSYLSFTWSKRLPLLDKVEVLSWAILVCACGVAVCLKLLVFSVCRAVSGSTRTVWDEARSRMVAINTALEEMEAAEKAVERGEEGAIARLASAQEQVEATDGYRVDEMIAGCVLVLKTFFLFLHLKNLDNCTEDS